MIDLFSGTFFFVLGACVGSFLNVCIARWPHELSVVRPRSRCPYCGHRLTWLENIPLVSWVALRARCRSCRAPISAQYPVVELLVALGWLLSAAVFGPGFTAVRVAVFGTIMLGIAVTDARHYLIPDGFTVFGLVWVIGTALFSSATGGDTTLFAGAFDAVVGACAGAGAIRIIGWLGEVVLRKEAMGQGDETLMAVVGGALGPGRTLLTIFLGAFVGAIAFVLVVYPIVRLRRAREEQIELGFERAATQSFPLVPFGVFLAPAALIALVWGQHLISWYVGQMLAAS